MPQLTQGLCLDLTDALAGYLEALAYFFERVLGAVFKAEAHLDYALFTRRQCAQHLRGVFLQVDADDGIGWRYGLAVFNEVAKMRIFFFADRRLERNRFLRDLKHLADLRDRDIHAPGNFFRGRLAAKLLHQLTRSADELVDRLDHVHRDTDRAGLGGNGARDGLTNPPGSIGREFVTATVFEFIDRLHQANVAFLNQVEELETAVGVLLRNRNNESQVSFNQLALRLLGIHVALNHLALCALEFGDRDSGFLLQFFEVDPAVFLLTAIFLLQLFALRLIVFLIERFDLALEHAHRIDSLVQLVEKALALLVRVLQLADDA